MRKIVTTLVVCGAVAACGGGDAKDASNMDNRGGLRSTTPERNMHLRASFDANPGNYVGRWIPAELTGNDLDENRASKTTCSQFWTFNEVPADQDMDELVYASNAATASVGAVTQVGPMKVGGEHASSNVLRVHYKITKKLQINNKADELKACCAANPGECTDQVIGEFVMGTGEIYQANQSDNGASGSYGVAPVAAQASYKDSSKWHKVQSFHDQYFAFVPVSSGMPNKKANEEDEAKKRAAMNSCDFCNAPPTDADNKYFCGVSPPAITEADGRDAAMTNARAQVVKYLGEQVTSSSTTLSSTAKGVLEDKRFTEAFSKGIASQVLAIRSCSEKQNSPDHPSVYKVLARVPNDAMITSASRAVEDVAKEQGGKAKPADIEAAKAAVKKAAK